MTYTLISTEITGFHLGMGEKGVLAFLTNLLFQLYVNVK